MLHAYDFACKKRFENILAFAFTPNKNTMPKSMKMFKSLGFHRVMDGGDAASVQKFDQLHGMWFLKPKYQLDGLLEGALALCTRDPLSTRRGARKVWRCG